MNLPTIVCPPEFVGAIPPRSEFAEIHAARRLWVRDVADQGYTTAEISAAIKLKRATIDGILRIARMKEPKAVAGEHPTEVTRPCPRYTPTLAPLPFQIARSRHRDETRPADRRSALAPILDPLMPTNPGACARRFMQLAREVMAQ